MFLQFFYICYVCFYRCFHHCSSCFHYSFHYHFFLNLRTNIYIYNCIIFIFTTIISVIILIIFPIINIWNFIAALPINGFLLYPQAPTFPKIKEKLCFHCKPRMSCLAYCGVWWCPFIITVCNVCSQKCCESLTFCCFGLFSLLPNRRLLRIIASGTSNKLVSDVVWSSRLAPEFGCWLSILLSRVHKGASVWIVVFGLLVLLGN